MNGHNINMIHCFDLYIGLTVVAAELTTSIFVCIFLCWIIVTGKRCKYSNDGGGCGWLNIFAKFTNDIFSIWTIWAPIEIYSQINYRNAIYLSFARSVQIKFRFSVFVIGIYQLTHIYVLFCLLKICTVVTTWIVQMGDTKTVEFIW